MKMKELFSLQLDADKINKQLYLNQLKRFKNPNDIYKKILKSTEDIIDKYKDIETLLKVSSLLIDEQPYHYFNDVHAQYTNDAGKRKIWINPIWVQEYTHYMGETKSRELHIAHELYHYIEEVEPFWYKKEKRKDLKIISEVSAIMFSQMMTQVENNPVIYEYLVLIKNGNLKLEEVKKHIEEVYHEIY